MDLGKKKKSVFTVGNIFSTFSSETDNENNVKIAMLNTVAILAVLVIIAITSGIYFILQPFLKPLLWAVICGSVLHPFKLLLADKLRTEIIKLSADSSPFYLSVLCMPFSIVLKISDSLGNFLLAHRTLLLKTIGALCALLVLYLYLPNYILQFNNFFFALNRYVLIFLLDIFHSTLIIFSLLVAFITALHFLWKPERRNEFYVFNVILWLALTSWFSNFFGYIRLPVFVLIQFIMIGSYLYSVYCNFPEKSSSDTTTEDNDKTESDLMEKDGLQDQNTPNTEINSMDYIKWLFLICSVVLLISFPSFPYIFMFLVTIYAVKCLCIVFGIMEMLQTHLNTILNQMQAWLALRKDVLFPFPLKQSLMVLHDVRKKILLIIHDSCDSAAAVIVILALLFLGFFSTLFLTFQVREVVTLQVLCLSVIVAAKKYYILRHSHHRERISAILVRTFCAWSTATLEYDNCRICLLKAYKEGVYLIQVGSDFINQSVIHNPDLHQMLPEDWKSTGETALNNAYMYAREGITTLVRTAVKNRGINEQKSLEIENSALELWDRAYQAWVMPIQPQVGPTVTPDAVFSSCYSFMERLSKTPEVMSIEWAKDFVKENMALLTSGLDSAWSILKGNMSLLLSIISTMFSLVFGGGLSVINFGIQSIIFLTALFYLLSTSRSMYKPVEVVTDLSPKYGKRFALAVENSCREVLAASAKLSMFYGLWTWLIHKVFQSNLAYMPAVFASVLGVVPVFGTYWVCVPAIVDLWFVQESRFRAIGLFVAQLFPTMIVETVIFNEIKGGHPYLTALSVAGGMFWLGIEGAIVGPLILCFLFVFLNMLSSQNHETL